MKETRESLTQPIYEAYINAYMKSHPELTREQAEQEVTKLATDGD